MTAAVPRAPIAAPLEREAESAVADEVSGRQPRITVKVSKQTPEDTKPVNEITVKSKTLRP